MPISSTPCGGAEGPDEQNSELAEGLAATAGVEFGVANPHIPVDNPPPSEAQIPLRSERNQNEA
jgi:hypothetical protein